MNKGSVYLFSSPVSPVHKRFFECMPGKSLLLFQGCIQCMTVIIIPGDVQRPDNDATVLGNGNRYLAAKFIFLMFLALADAYYFRFMKAIDFVAVLPLLPEYPLK